MVKDIEFNEQFGAYADRLWELAYNRGKEDGYNDAYEEFKIQEEVNEETATFKLNQIKEQIEDLELYRSLPSSTNTLSVGEVVNKDDIIKYYTIEEIIDYVFRTKTLIEEIGV